MATKDKLKNYELYFDLNDVMITKIIKAESYEQALEQGRLMKIDEILDGYIQDYTYRVSGVFEQK